MISSIVELIAHCRVAQERNLSHSTDQDDVVRFLNLPPPNKVTNEQLDMLKPLYHQLLTDKNIISHLETSTEHAILISYILAYPGLVRAARQDQLGFTDCHVQESFPLVDIAQKIATDSSICSWCRGKLCSSALDSCSITVTGNSIPILRLSLELSGKKHNTKTVFQGEKNKTIALDTLQNDLEAVANRSGLDPDDVGNCVCLFLDACSFFLGKTLGLEEVMDCRNMSAFHGPIHRSRNSLGEQAFVYLAMLTRAPMNISDLAAIGNLSSNVDGRGNPDRAICDAGGCMETGEKLCGLCRLASYCSKECQILDWRQRHKRCCAGRKASSSSTEELDDAISMAVADVRKKASPAFKRQQNLLDERPDSDYFIFFDGRGIQRSVVFEEGLGQGLFHFFMAFASECPGCVYRMYQVLSSVDEDSKDVIRRQLRDEYGVDPLSPEAIQGYVPKVSEHQEILQQIIKRRQIRLS